MRLSKQMNWPGVWRDVLGHLTPLAIFLIVFNQLMARHSPRLVASLDPDLLQARAEHSEAP